MKKLGVILAILAALSFAGCGSSGGGGGGGEAYSVDLSTLQVANWSYTSKGIGEHTAGVRNVEPFSRQYDGVLVIFPELPVDVTGYQRVTIRCSYFSESGNEVTQADGNAMVVLIYDISGDLEGPEMGPGRNTPLKEFNIGGFSAQVSTDRGTRISLTQNPGGILFQASSAGVKFIEVTEITFHD